MSKAAFSLIDLIRSTLSPILPYLDDPSTNEVMINGPDDVWVEKAGRIERVTNLRISREMIDGAIRVLASNVGKDVKEGGESSLVNARMPGFRIAAVMAPVSVRGSSVAVRKHSTRDFTLDDYVAAGAFSNKEADTLREIISAHKNILVAGGTSSGKTTFLNALVAEIDPAERILTVEDTQELKVKAPNWVAFESNKQHGVSTVSLVEMCLRYRPDRILVGEVRGAEAADLIEACNTGHDGALATVHANDPLRALSRMETLVMRAGQGWPLSAIRKEIAETFNVVVYMRRIKGERLLTDILEVHGFDPQTDTYLTESLFKRSFS